MDASRRAQRLRQEEMMAQARAAAPPVTTAVGEVVEAPAVNEQDVLLQPQYAAAPPAPAEKAGCVFQAVTRCPWPFLLAVGAMMLWRAGVGVCGPEFPSEGIDSCVIPEISTAVDDFRTRGTLISLRDNTAVVFKGNEALVDRIPLDCAQVPNGKAVKDACGTCMGTCGLCPGEPMCSERVWRGQVPGCERCSCCPDPDAVQSLTMPTGRRLSSAPQLSDDPRSSSLSDAPDATPAAPHRRRAQASCGMPALRDLTPGVVTRMCPAGATACADGSEFSFLVRRGSGANERKVLVDFMGGGACWDAECLRPDSTRFQSVWSALSAVDGLTSADAGERLSLAGFSAFALGDSADSLGDTSTWTYVFVPYCTQDIHLGTCTQTYTDPTSGETRTLRHNGMANTRAAVDWATTSSFPVSSPPDTLAFVGCSAGAAAVVVTEAARASTVYADSGVQVVAVGDSPSNTLTEAFVFDGLLKWGVLDSLEELAATTGFTPSPLRSSLLTDAVSAVLDAFPMTRMGFYSSTSDTTAGSYWIRMGGVQSDASADQAAASWVRNMLAGLERLTGQGHDNFQTFIGDIPGHCTMTFDVARGNSDFDRWVTDMLDGQSPGSRDCGDGCMLATVEGCDGITGSGRVEDRCGICDGEGTTCAARTGALCTCDARDDDDENVACEESAVPAQDHAWPPTLAGATYSRWDGISGTSMDDLLSAEHYIADPPDEFSFFLDFFESPSNICDNCGTVMDAYFRPTVAGEFTFMLAADDNAYLWFGRSVDVALALEPIASVPGWTAPRQWDRYAEQIASPVTLAASEYYYLRAAVNEGGGGDNLCVGVTGAMGDLLPIPVMQNDGTVLLFRPPPTAAEAGGAGDEIAPPVDCSDADLSAVSPGLNCAAAVYALGCNTDLSTVVPGQAGTLASLCPVACDICSAPAPPPAALNAVGLEFEAYECGRDANAGCKTDGGFHLQTSASSHLDEVWDGMTPTLHELAFELPIWFPSRFDAISGLSSSRAHETIMRWRGFLRVPSAGSYVFQTRSDDGSLLYLNNELVVDNDGNHGMQTMEGTVDDLAAGFHSIAILYYNNAGGGGLEVSWRGSDGTFQPLGPDDTRPTVPGLHLEVYSFSSESIASVERGILGAGWNGGSLLEQGVFDSELWWTTREAVYESISTENRPSALVARWSGRLHTAVSGQHVFKLRSGDGSRLYVGGRQITDNDGHHSMTEQSGTAILTAGWHAIVLVYYSMSQHGDGGLQVSILSPGSSSFEPLNVTETRPRRASPAQGLGNVDVCSCGTNLDTIFAAPEGASILTAAAFHSICEWEDTLMSDEMLAYTSHCQASSSGSCCLPQSLPRMLSSALRVPCASLTDEHISSLLSMLNLGSISLGTVSLDTIADGFINEEWLGAADISLATHSRSILCLDAGSYPRIEGTKAGSNEALGKTVLIPYDDHLEQAARDTSEDEPRRFVFNMHLFHAFFLKQLFRDLYLAGAAFVLLFLCLAFHTGSICMATCGMLHIVLSVPISYGIYMQQLEFEVFPYINLIGIFVVAGIGVDDIYVFTDAWKQSFYLLPEDASLADRLSFAYKRATTAMLITSLTTAVAFLVNTVSPIPPIRLFGIWMALLICVDYALVITWYPLIQLANHKMCHGKWCCCFCRRAKSQKNAALTSEAGGGGPEFEGRIERCFHSGWSAMIFRIRAHIAVVMLGVSVAAGYLVFDQLTLATQEVQLLRSDHQFSRYLQQVDLFRASPHRVGRKMTVELYFGVVPADCTEVLCYYINSNRGELAVDPDFDIADPAAQTWMLGLVSELRAQPWVDRERTREHPLENFDRWLKEWGGETMDQPCVPRCNCTRCDGQCPLSRLPLEPATFYECHEQFLRTGFRVAPGLAAPGSENEPGGTYWFRNSTVPPNSLVGSMPVRAPATRFFKWNLETNEVGSWDYYKTIGIFDRLEEILQRHRAIRPASAGDGGFFTHWWFTISDLQANLASSALESMVLATAITLLVLLLATRSVQATIIATVAIAGVLCCTMAVLVALGWEMGIIESMCLAILIGISCDFVVHIAWAYVTAGDMVDAKARAPPEQRILRARNGEELRALANEMRKQLGLQAPALAYDAAKPFPRNRSSLADEVARVVVAEPAVAKAEDKLLLQRVRFARTQFALGSMGISVSSAAVTTLVAAVALSQGIIEFFHAFGLFLIFTISFALVFAIVFFAAGSMMCGPTSRPCSRCRTGKAEEKALLAKSKAAQAAVRTTDL